MKCHLIAVTFLITLLTVPSQGGFNRWTPSLQSPTSSPWELGVVAIDQVDPTIAYAATTAGVFKTTDRGGQWTLVEAFPNATAIAIDPRNRATVVAGNSDPYTYLAQLRRSEDGGATWRDVHSFEWESYVVALTFDVSEPDRVYAALSNSGIGKSADGGKTWTISDYRNGLLCCLVDFWHTLDVATAGGSSPTIYAASDLLFSSTDGAESWQRVDLPPFSSSSEPLEAWTVSTDPRDAQRLYVTGFFQPHNGPGAFTSVDGGKQWQRLPVTTTNRIMVDPRVPTTLYTSVSESSAPARGVLRSTDRGATWTEFNSGLTDLKVYSVSVDTTGSLLYASTPSGIFVYEVQAVPRRRSVRR